jgi:hypothetical protein
MTDHGCQMTDDGWLLVVVADEKESNQERTVDR